MTTAVVKEIKRLSPHGTTPVAPLRSMSGMSGRGQRLAGGGALADRAGRRHAARGAG